MSGLTYPKFSTYDANDDPLIVKLTREALIKHAFVADKFTIEAVLIDTLLKDAVFDSLRLFMIVEFTLEVVAYEARLELRELGVT